MSHKTATLLVVDDEENNRNVIVAQLKTEGYAFITAASGEEALELIDQQLPDLILLDVMMPGISGFDVAEILKSEERTATIPIIMITALGDGNSRLTGLTSGVEEFLTKPVSRAELLMRVRNLLRLKEYQDDLSTYNNALEGRVADRTKELESASLQLSEAQTQLLQSEKLAALGQLAAGVAHEINNPVGYVNSNIGTLKGYTKDLIEILRAYEEINQKHTPDPELMIGLQKLKDKHQLDYICEDAPQLIDESLEGLSRIRKIVQDLKNFAHTDVDPEWKLEDMHECLDSALNIANNEIKYKAKVIREYGQLPEIECLGSQLSQVFLNLLINAAHAIPDSEQGTITVRTSCDNDEVSIEISDTGCGIPAENLTRIFDPFFTTKPIGQGTGLGLSLSYGIVQRHNGRIEVRSETRMEAGRGTTFRVVLPLRRPVEPCSTDSVPGNN